MAMSDWSTTAASNGTALGINIAENCPAANVNNALREIMAQTRATITTNALSVSGNGSIGGAFTITGNSTVGGTLGVTGAATLSSTLAVSGNATVGGTFGVTGNVTFSGTLGVTSNATVGGTLGVTGAATFGSSIGATGAITGSAGLFVDSNAYYNILTSKPTLAFDSNDFLEYDRSGNTLSLKIGGSTKAQFSASALTITGNIAASGAVSVNSPTTSQFYLDTVGGNPRLNFALNQLIYLDAGATAFGFTLDNTLQAYVNKDGLVWARAGMSVNGNTVWHAGNDGTGSDLDAGKFAGHALSEFVRVTSSSIVENGGYRVYSDGLIETWGYIDITADSTGTYTLPVAHTSWVVPAISAYWPSDQTDSAHAVDWTSNNGTPPTSISFRNADDRTVRVWIHTKGA